MQGSHYENHQRAAELHNEGTHAHDVAARHGKQDHLTGHEHSRQAMEHDQDAHEHPQAATAGHGIAAFGHREIAVLAHELWEAKGRPEGSAEEDWFQAVKELRSRAYGH